jgi:predicted glycosyltransferase
VTGRPTVLFYCQHSLGLGHLVRSFALAQGLCDRFRVVLLNGGPMPRGIVPPAGVEIVSIAPLGMDTDGRLVSRDGRRSVERALALRHEQIMRVLGTVTPDVIFIELFPFGRKKFAGELLALLEAARIQPRRPVVVSSLRDILVGQRHDQARHDERAATQANEHFDAVLVHTDPRFARLDESFRPATPLAIPVHYTGFVLPATAAAAPAATSARPRVVVSAGGGLYGEPLMNAAVDAHRDLAHDGVDVDLVTGPFLPAEAWRGLGRRVRGRHGLRLRRSVPDLCAEMRGASASISQCGYNTALDVMQSRVPALVIPFAEGREDEQTRRAERLGQMGVVRVLSERDLTGPRLADEIRGLLSFEPARVDLQTDGARQTSRILVEMVSAR